MSDLSFTKDVQRLLGVEPDGVVGRQTREALAQALAARGISTARALGDPGAFFAAVRDTFGVLKQSQVDGFNALLSAMGSAGWSIAWTAYGLATAWHETAFTMQPIEEYGRGHGRPYGVKDATGQAPYGRGYVQLTWGANYKKAAAELGVPKLATDYDLALDPEIAARILVEGMEGGWFTGKGLVLAERGRSR
jgi:hypothetical protein